MKFDVIIQNTIQQTKIVLNQNAIIEMGRIITIITDYYEIITVGLLRLLR